MFADLVIDLFVAQVGLHAQPRRLEPGRGEPGVVVAFGGDGGHHDLGRGQPQGEGAGIVLDQYAQEPLDGAEQCPVQQHGTLLGAVLLGIFRVQPFGQDEVQLQGAALPGAADGVAQVELQLGAIEGAFAREQFDLHAGGARGAFQLGLGHVPHLVRAGPQVRPQRQLDRVQVHVQVGIDRVEQLDELGRLFLDLFLAAEDVGVVLGEGAQAHDAVQGARRLIAVAGAELGHAQGQVAIGLLADIEDLDVARAIHRLDRQNLFLRRFADEHGVAELLPVARAFPQAAIEDLGRLDLHIAVVVQPAADIVFQGAEQGPALGVPEHHALALFLQVEEVHAAPDLAVVAALGFLDALQIGFELGLGGPGGAIDALQLGVVLVAAPIGAGQLGQLEGLAHMARGRQVRPTAQVLPVSLVIDRDRLAGRDALNDLGLVGLAHGVEVGDGRIAVDHFARDLFVAVDDLAHARLDRRQVVQGEGLVAGEVVEEAVLDIGADGHLGSGEQLLHRLGQQVGGVVADHLQGFGGVAGDDLDRPGALDRPVEVAQLAVQLDQQGLLFQGFGDRGGHVAAGDAVLELTAVTIGEFQVDHVSHVNLRWEERGGTGSTPDPPQG